jgi:hypothetical protein
MYKYPGGKDMKKALILAVFFICASLAVSAQGLYLDAGLGFGKAWTVFDDYDVADELKSGGANVHEIAIDLSLKAGYGPFGKTPLYVVGELGGMGHRIFDSSGYIQFNSYIIGPGVIFYPIPLIQLASSIGYSYIANQTNTNDLDEMCNYNSKGGFAYNISAAVDLGLGKHATLIGIKYFYAINSLEGLNASEKSKMISIFVKYTRRKKPSLLF